MAKKLTDSEVEEYRILFYWYRYQFFIRSGSFRARFDSLGPEKRIEMLIEASDFFYISQLVLDDSVQLEDYPFPGFTAPETHARRGRPKNPEEGSFPAKKSSAILPVRDGTWNLFVLQESCLARKKPGGKKTVGDFIWPFLLWEKSLLVHDLVEYGLSRTEVGNIVNGKTVMEVLQTAHSRGIRPIKYDILSRLALECPSNDLIIHDLDFGRTYFTPPRPENDQENLRRDLLACVGDAHERADNLIRSAEAGQFPFYV